MGQSLGRRYMSALFKTDLDPIVGVTPEKYTLLHRYLAGIFGVRLIQRTSPEAPNLRDFGAANQEQPLYQGDSSTPPITAIHEEARNLTSITNVIARETASYRLGVRRCLPVSIFIRLRDIAQGKNELSELNNAMVRIGNDTASMRADRNLSSDISDMLVSTRNIASSLERLLKKLGLEAHMQSIRRGMAVHYELIDFEHIHVQIMNLDDALSQKFCESLSQLPGNFNHGSAEDQDIREGISTIERASAMITCYSREYRNRAAEEFYPAIGKLYSTVSDMMGFDLRHGDLAGVPLKGVRWSAETMWPPEWSEAIYENSVVLGENLFEVDADGFSNRSSVVQV